MKDGYMLMVVAALTAGTAITRFLPFILFPQEKKMPRYVEYLGERLPSATMGLLIVYCMKETDFVHFPFGLAELLACGAVVLLHILKRNSLLSIGAGTLFYMLLVQTVF